MKNKLIVGQKVWVIPTSNEARRNPNPFEAEVIKVGSKLFELNSPNRKFWHKFELETMQEKSEYTSDFAVYASKQEWIDENEIILLQGMIKNDILHITSLEQLRAINNLIKSFK